MAKKTELDALDEQKPSIGELSYSYDTVKQPSLGEIFYSAKDPSNGGRGIGEIFCTYDDGHIINMIAFT